MLTIRLGLFDDHDIVRAGFRYILGEHSDIDIVAEGGTGRAALEALRATPMDVCVIDLSLPDLSGIDVLRQVKLTHPETAILILSAYPEEQYGLNVLKAGASGFLSKELATDQLVSAVRTVAAGRRFVSPRLEQVLILKHNFRDCEVTHGVGAFAVRSERPHACRRIIGLVRIINLEIEDVAGNEPEEDSLPVETNASEHPLCVDGPYHAQLIEDVVQISLADGHGEAYYGYALNVKAEQIYRQTK